MGTTLSDPLVGQTLDGRYQVIRRLARGGMATVYEALDTRLERTVALKVMHPGLAEDKAFVERFIREARSAARLSHPGVVGVFDQSADSGHVFLAMEYVAGRNLRDWMREKGRLTPREAFAVLEPVLAALGAAHEAGIIHRDIKPENVLIADDGRVKVADFGLARAATTTSTTGTALIGTVAYLAPEQVERGVADTRSDVYAAGILLFEVLTGVQPFSGETPIQVAYQHVNYDVPPPSDYRETLPPQLDALVTRATRRSPDERPANATALLTEVVACRRSLTQAELDDAGPPLPADPSAHTLVVPREQHGAPAAPRPAPVPAYQMPPQHTAPLPGTGGRGQAGDPYALPQRFAKRRRRGVLALALVLAAALILGVGAWKVAEGGSVSTPSLIGKTRAEAKAVAEKAGLDLVFAKEERFDERVPAGEVLETDPDPGQTIGKHGTITAVLSAGPERHEVPDLKGMSLSEAEDELERRNLTIGSAREEFSDSVESGQVIRTEPAKGEKLARDAVVTPIVSKGGRPVRVPDVTGRTLAEAQVLLQQAGFEVGTVTEENDGRYAPGTVIAQDPRASRRVDRGTEVSLVVSKGPELVVVPNVIGMSPDDAEKVLEDLGLEVEVHRSFFFGDGTVTSQDPIAGTQVPKGTRVELYTD